MLADSLHDNGFRFAGLGLRPYKQITYANKEWHTVKQASHFSFRIAAILAAAIGMLGGCAGSTTQQITLTPATLPINLRLTGSPAAADASLTPVTIEIDSTMTCVGKTKTYITNQITAAYPFTRGPVTANATYRVCISEGT